ncbi:MAG: hypothetical protein HY735_15570 [Verrucomicrobia bacterium]|nr:hypothetical protein [Verrucomicrobiota bacterium]
MIISFPALPDQTPLTQEILLNATTDSGLPVEYFVASGPAEVVGTNLRLTRIPPRSRFPVRVTVVACQFGRVVEPLYRSAEPVVRTFHVVR